MAPFDWHPSLAVGYRPIDEQHRHLFGLAESVLRPPKSISPVEAGARSLAAIVDFTRQHFAFEEALMRESGYAEGRGHAILHASLLADLDAHCSIACDGQPANWVASVQFLYQWLYMHIRSADRQLVGWIARC